MNLARYKDLRFEDRGRGATVDCWGLVVQIYRDEFGVTLPSYAEAYVTTTDREEIRALIDRERPTAWRDVPMDQAREGDVLLLRMQGLPMHVGVVVDPPRFVHALRSPGVVIERWDSVLWKRRVLGCYRLREAHG